VGPLPIFSIGVGEGAGGACVDGDTLPLADSTLAGGVAKAARDACLPVEVKVVVVVTVLLLHLAICLALCHGPCLVLLMVLALEARGVEANGADGAVGAVGAGGGAVARQADTLGLADSIRWSNLAGRAGLAEAHALIFV
jgi:hypothetical protein